MLHNLTNVNSSNSMYDLEMSTDLLITGTLLYSTIFIVGIIGNGLVLYVLSIEKDLRNFTVTNKSLI